MRHDSTTYWHNLDTLTRSATGHDEIADLRVPGLTVLAHSDVRRVGERSALTALASGREVALSRLEPIFAAPGTTRRRPLADPHLSRQPLRLVPAPEGAIRLITGGSKTRVAAHGHAIEESRDFSAAELEHGVVVLLADRITLLLHLMDPLPPQDVPRYGLVGESAGMVAVRQQIARLADVDVPALLRGETGTGKELVAGAIHEASKRSAGAFVAVNMGAIPPTLAPAELFGAVKGAFTGAERKRTGYFSRARGGTLFLDEIGETPAEVQVMLLRALETGEIEPVGAEKADRVDVRILAATDAHLEADIEAGRFRAPLLHRLSGYEIRLPPLRERRDDVGLLLLYFLRRELETLGETWRFDERGPARREAWLPASLVARLADYAWPGNVRQLRNVARQLVIHNRGAPRLRITAQIEELLETPDAAAEPIASIRSGETAGRQADVTGDRAVVKTLLFTDLVASTRLIEQLGDQRAAEVMARHDRVARRLLARHGGLEIDKSDGFLLLFDRPADAVAFALAFHEALETLSGELGAKLESRVGIHLGEVFLRRNAPAEIARGAKPLEVEGLAKPMAARLMALAAAGQTLLTRHAFDLARQAAERDAAPLGAPRIRWLSHGPYSFQGVSDEVEIFEVGAEGSAPLIAPDDPEKRPGERDADATAEKRSPAKSRAKYRPPSDVGEEELLAALRRHEFRLQPAAATLGVSRTSLYALIEKSDRVRKPRDLERDEIESCSERCAGDLDAMAAELEVSRKGLHRRMTQLGLL